MGLVTPLFQEIPYQQPIQLFALLEQKSWSILFDSATHQHPFQNTNRYSYIAVSPYKTISLKNGIIQGSVDKITDPFALLKNNLLLFKTQKISGLPPFQGGLAGYFAYDLCHYLEKIPYPTLDDMKFPDLAVGFYDCVLSFDHQDQRAWIISTGFPETNENVRQQRAKSRLKELLALITAKQEKIKTPKHVGCDLKNITANFSKKDYLKIINIAKNYILSGDIYEVNLSQRFKSELPHNFSSFALYQHLRKINPAPFAAYLNLEKIIIASASPERFILSDNHVVETRPIKGTMLRGKTPQQDRQFAQQLLQSKKDRAENVMIVDLMRNDLSRICEDDSVHVEKLCGLESYATVHHLVSVITGKLKPPIDALDLLKATFPGGSITGVPKIRAMQIIAALEPHRRGPYCGSIGFVSFTGDMDSSIAIRTYAIHDRILTYQSGGAIVLDSDPAQEYQETLNKAHALTQALLHT